MMQADAFWKNYMAAHQWQKRHCIAWWKSRCLALEYENRFLRDKLKELNQCSRQQTSKNSAANENKWKEETNEGHPGESEYLDDEEDFEFHVNEDMLSFLEQSVRHKLELQQKREHEEAASMQDEKLENAFLRESAAWLKGKNANAKLLYGEASPRILAMEAALEATMDRHKDQAKPQYWPNIPLKL